jgi:F0F1-type ATP synthase membrane subunit b/b'
VSPALATFLFEAANFLLLVAALGWLLFRPIRGAIDAERARHAKAVQDLAAQRTETEAAVKAARDARAQLEHDVEHQRTEARAAAEQEATRIREEARRTQAEARRTLERELDAARGAQAAALSDVLGHIAAASVRRLLEALDGPALDLALIRGACHENRALPPAARAAALVETARPLDGEARQLLAAALGGSVEARIVAELGAGVRVTTPAGQVDASALALARLAAHDVTVATRGAPAGGESPHA